MQKPCSACRERNLGSACTISLIVNHKPPVAGKERAPWMWELTEAEHSDLIDIVMRWQRYLSETISLRLDFLHRYPNAFHSAESRRGHLNAIQIAKQENCKITTRLLDHFAWRDLPTSEFGEPQIRWNRSTMADMGHYGTHNFSSTSQSPTKRLQDSERGLLGGRVLRRTD